MNIDFTDAKGHSESISKKTKTLLLKAITVTGQVNKSPVEPVKVFKQGEPYSISVKLTEFSWQLYLENNETFEGRHHQRSPLILTETLPVGYHRLLIKQKAQCWSCRIIIAPEKCYEPASIIKGQHLWGITQQLYTLRSDTNWGIGDFTDLKQMIHFVVKRKGAFIGLNPLHALFPALPENASPYSPSSRRWLNIIYIDVNVVPEFISSKQAKEWWLSTETQQQCNLLRQNSCVDYQGVMTLKLHGLWLAFHHFIALDATHPRKQACNHFIESGGDDLMRQAVFDALHHELISKDEHYIDWQDWPEKYRAYDSPDVKLFIQQHQPEIHFYLWLQWIAHDQLMECHNLTKQLEMPIGLYHDLAVGVAAGGSETWGNRQFYAMEATVGAPPDLLGPQGQNWLLPPMNPIVMKQQAYQPFIELLRANMRYCSALRIDHVMSLLRLWWVPKNHTADEGAYVPYPVDDLLSILALESQRHQCMVIGEDLGIVPDAIIDKLKQAAVYSYRVLFFEQDKKHRFTLPENYKSQAIATVSTHDLPTAAGYWNATDLTLGEKLGIYQDKDLVNKLKRERRLIKKHLTENLVKYHCVDETFLDGETHQKVDNQLIKGLYCYIAKSNSILIGIQPDDLLVMDMPVNIPGTNKEYQNWRRKLNKPLEEIIKDKTIKNILQAIQQCRDKLSKQNKKKYDNERSSTT